MKKFINIAIKTRRFRKKKLKLKLCHKCYLIYKKVFIKYVLYI